MFRKTILNKLKLFTGVTLCALAVFSSPISSLTVCAAAPEDVEVCTDFREWVYKIEDGKLYKALYNNSTGQLETDWIYLCDYPEGIE